MMFAISRCGDKTLGPGITESGRVEVGQIHPTLREVATAEGSTPSVSAKPPCRSLTTYCGPAHGSHARRHLHSFLKKQSNSPGLHIGTHTGAQHDSYVHSTRGFFRHTSYSL